MTETDKRSNSKDWRYILRGTYLIALGLSLTLVWLTLTGPVLEYLWAQPFFRASISGWALGALAALWTWVVLCWTVYLVRKGYRCIGGQT